MIIHLFNSSMISGPETLAVPQLKKMSLALQDEIEVWNLAETRVSGSSHSLLEYAQSFGLNARDIPVSRRIDANTVKTLAHAILDKRPKIVHAHDVKASIYLVLAACYLRWKAGLKAPSVKITTHHGIHARNGFFVRFYEYIYRFLFLFCFERVLVVCSSDREILLRQGLSKNKVLVHLNGIDRTCVLPEAREEEHEKILENWKKIFGIDFKNKLVLGVVARLSPEKNHHLLLDSLALLKKLRTDWVCLCFGIGPLENELREKTLTLGLEKHVLWAGYRSQLSEEIAGFDLLMSFSVGEGLPINLLEAGWVGTPILATRVDGVNDLLPSSDALLQSSGLPSNAKASDIVERLNFLAESSGIRKALGIAFQKRVQERFSGDSWRRDLQQIYDASLESIR